VITLLLAAVLLQAAPPAAAAEPAAAEVTIATDREEVFVGEPVRIRIRLALDAERFRERAVPLTLRRTGLPVLLDAPWLRGLAAPGPVEGPTLLAGDGVSAAKAAGTVARDGRTFEVYLLERRLVPDRPGPLVLAAPRLRWAEAGRIEEDVLGEAVPRDRREFSVEGTALSLRVLPLPAAGRPEGFAGPVGRFTLAAAADRGDAVVGGSVRLLLTVAGDGDPETFPEPAPGDLPGFHILGRLRGPAADGARTWTWDLAPLDAGVREVPAIPYPHFDPTPPGRYAVARSAPIPLRVRADAAPPPGSPVPAPGEPRVAPWIRFLLGAIVFGAAIVLAARRRRRGPGGTPPRMP
jgi:hypothetical protein